MELFDTVFEVIDMRSFSNLWYWIALAVLWSSTSHWVLGVPHDMIQRGRREGGQAQADVEDLVRINSGRLLNMVDTGALIIVAFACFWFTVLGVLAFYYDVEFAQAVFLLLAPMTLVVWLSILTCRKISAEQAKGEELHRRLTVHRRLTQTIGMLAILVTALYGTWQNVSVSILH
ncbi:MAG: component of SufBCD complex [Rhodobacter sp.]|nr:component of SufBCD complex [Rhodobacter sp.]